MMHAVASYLCRGIEAVITGLTRNQFVDNTTRGFESLPLRQKKDTLCGCPFIMLKYLKYMLTSKNLTKLLFYSIINEVKHTRWAKCHSSCIAADLFIQKLQTITIKNICLRY